MKSKVQCRCDFVLRIACTRLTATNVNNIIEKMHSKVCGNADCRHSQAKTNGDGLSNLYCHDVTNKRPVKFTGRLFLDKNSNQSIGLPGRLRFLHQMHLTFEITNLLTWLDLLDMGSAITSLLMLALMPA